MAKPADLVALAESGLVTLQEQFIPLLRITIDQAVGLALWIDDDLQQGRQATFRISLRSISRQDRKVRHCHAADSGIASTLTLES